MLHAAPNWRRPASRSPRPWRSLAAVAITPHNPFRPQMRRPCKTSSRQRLGVNRFRRAWGRFKLFAANRCDTGAFDGREDRSPASHPNVDQCRVRIRRYRDDLQASSDDENHRQQDTSAPAKAEIKDRQIALRYRGGVDELWGGNICWLKSSLFWSKCAGTLGPTGRLTTWQKSVQNTILISCRRPGEITSRPLALCCWGTKPYPPADPLSPCTSGP